MDSTYALTALDLGALKPVLSNATISADCSVVLFPHKLVVAYPSGGYISVPMDLEDTLLLPYTIPYEQFSALASLARKAKHSLVADSAGTLLVLCGSEIVASETMENKPLRVPMQDVRVRVEPVNYMHFALGLKLLSGLPQSSCFVCEDLWYSVSTDFTSYAVQGLYEPSRVFDSPLSFSLTYSQLRALKAFVDRISSKSDPTPDLFLGYTQGFLKVGNRSAACLLDVSNHVKPVTIDEVQRAKLHCSNQDTMLCLSSADVKTLLELPKAANRPYGRITLRSHGDDFVWEYDVPETASQEAIRHSGVCSDATGFKGVQADTFELSLDALSFFTAASRLIGAVPSEDLGLTLLWNPIDPKTAIRVSSTEFGDIYYALTMPIFPRPTKATVMAVAEEVVEMDIDDEAEALTV